MGEEQGKDMDAAALEVPPFASRGRHFLALLIASLSLFWGTGTAYFHFFRLGTAVEENFYTNSVIGLHDFLGAAPVLVLAALPFLWAMVYFFTERIGGIGLKAFGCLVAAGFLSVLLGVWKGEGAGGSFGAAVGGRLEAFLGEKIALVLLLASTGMALFLATERFFSLRPARSPEAGPPCALAESPASGLTPEESREITAQPAAVAVGEAPPPAAKTAGKEPERFDLEAVLEIAPEPPAVPPPAQMAPPEAEEPPTRARREKRAAELDAALERATQDYILPPSVPAAPPESDGGGGMLNQAARLVIEEGRASVSLLQRRLGIPFSRASLLLDLLEKEGVIGPYRGGPSRDILLRLADWEQKARSRPSSPLPQA